MEQEILIKDGLILTMEAENPVIRKGYVLVRDKKIAARGAGAWPEILENTKEINAQGSIVMPGLVNCHTHLPMSLFKGLADDMPLDIWLNEYIFPAEAREINPDSVKKWSAHSIKELLLTGTTTCCDGYFHEDQVAEAVLASGIRAVLGQGVIDFPAPGVPDPKQNVMIAADYVARWKNRCPRITPSIFCHSPYTCSSNTLILAHKAARDLGVPFQIHVAETRYEKEMISQGNGLSPVAYLDELGLLDSKTILVHGVWLEAGDMSLIKERGAGLVHCPESNMKLASGIAPVAKMIRAGISLALGTDGSSSNNNLDLFSEMDMASKLQKVACLDTCVMDASGVLHMATLGGAKVLGLDQKIGSITPGKQADIIVIDTNHPHMTPLYNPFSSLVYSARGADVSQSMVDGRILVADGELV